MSNTLYTVNIVPGIILATVQCKKLVPKHGTIQLYQVDDSLVVYQIVFIYFCRNRLDVQTVVCRSWCHAMSDFFFLFFRVLLFFGLLITVSNSWKAALAARDEPAGAGVDRFGMRRQSSAVSHFFLSFFCFCFFAVHAVQLRCSAPYYHSISAVRALRDDKRTGLELHFYRSVGGQYLSLYIRSLCVDLNILCTINKVVKRWGEGRRVPVGMSNETVANRLGVRAQGWRLLLLQYYSSQYRLCIDNEAWPERRTVSCGQRHRWEARGSSQLIVVQQLRHALS